MISTLPKCCGLCLEWLQRYKGCMCRLLSLSLSLSFAINLIAVDWPSFRGIYASGVADGMNLPDKWDCAKGEGVLFKVKVPGLAHSSPIIVGNRIFLTTAVSSIADPTFKPGLYGAGTAAADRIEQVVSHEWGGEQRCTL